MPVNVFKMSVRQLYLYLMILCLLVQGLVGKLSSVLRSRGANVKEKLGNFIAESSQPVER